MGPRLEDWLRGLLGWSPPMPSYVAMLTVGWLAGLWLYFRRARAKGLPELAAIDMAIWAFIFSLVGARAIHVLQLYGYYLDHPLEVFALWRGGLVAYGGMIGAAAAGALYLRAKKQPVGAFADAAAPAVWLGAALTRIGCFMNGCCFGAPSDLPWAVRYPQGSKPFYTQLQEGLVRAGDALSQPVHPAQLYESLYTLAICALLVRFDGSRLRRFDGATAILGFLLYSVARFVNEALRADPARGFAGPLSTSQWIGIPVFALTLGLLLWGNARARRREGGNVAKG